MSVPKPQDRPDRKYWEVHWQERIRPSPEELAILKAEVEKYSILRFVVGRRFKLIKQFQGRPQGTGCTVIDVWPRTAVLWDKWNKTGPGSVYKTQNISFELDMHLEVI